MGGPRRSLSAGHVCAAARGIGVVCGVGVSGVCGTALWSRWPYLGSRSSFPRVEAPPPWSLPEAGPRAESRLPRAVTSPRSEGESALAVFLRHVRGLEAHDFAQVLQKPEPSHLSCQRRRWPSPKQGELGAARPTWAPGSRRGRAVRSARGRRSPVCREHGVARSPSPPPSPAGHPLAPHHPWGAPLVRSPVLGALGFLEGGRPASGFPRGWKQPVGRAPSSVAVAAPTETSSTLPRPPGGHEANAAACASKFPLPLPAQSWGAERAWGARRGHHQVTESGTPSNRAQSRLAVTAEETRKTLARASWGPRAKYRRVRVFRVAAETRRSPAPPPVPARASSGAKPRRGPAPCIRTPITSRVYRGLTTWLWRPAGTATGNLARTAWHKHCPEAVFLSESENNRLGHFQAICAIRA